MDLKARWLECLAPFGAVPALADAVWTEIAAAYAEPARHYHGPAHIEALLNLSVQHRAHLRAPAAIDLAIFFHDAIYDARRSDNEVLSAALAQDHLARLGVPMAVADRVASLIDMTRHGAVEPAPGDTDAHHFLDFDLSTLGAAPPLYDAYAAAIRREYAHVPPGDYRLGRARVLQGFLAQPRIYRVPALRGHWEDAARANLAREIMALEAARTDPPAWPFGPLSGPLSLTASPATVAPIKPIPGDKP